MFSKFTPLFFSLFLNAPGMMELYATKVEILTVYLKK